jgi:hypothetical protein
LYSDNPDICAESRKKIRVIRRCAIFLVEIQRGGKRMDEIPRCFMMLRKETMTPEMGWRSA